MKRRNNIWVVEFWMGGRWEASVNVRLTKRAAMVLARSFRRADLGRYSGEKVRYRVKRYEVQK